jgi:hypothetical protein
MNFIEGLEGRVLLSTTVLPKAKPATQFQHSGTTISFGLAGDVTKGVRVGNQAVFVGTGSLPFLTDFPSDLVNIYSSATGQWTEGHLPQKTVPSSIAGAGKYVIIPGVHAGDLYADIYDASAAAWTSHTLSENGTEIFSVGNKVFVAGGNATLDVFDSADGSWSTRTLGFTPVMGAVVGNRLVLSDGISIQVLSATDNSTVSSSLPVNENAVVSKVFAVGDKVYFLNTFLNRLSCYDLTTQEWNTSRSPKNLVFRAVVGTKILCADLSANRFWLFNTVTESWRTRSGPAGINVGGSFAVVGGKVLFAGNFSTGAYKASNKGVVYNSSHDSFSTIPFSNPRRNPSAVSINGQVVFASGHGQNGKGASDIYVDNFPRPMLSGFITGSIRSTVNVTLSNDGDASLHAPCVLNLYASRDRSTHNAILIKSLPILSEISPGETSTHGLSSLLPVKLPRGRFHLVAAIEYGKQLTPIASQDGYIV